MLANQTAPDVLEQLQRLGTLGIRAHTQIVLCPGVNDGAHLDRSLTDLAALYPTVQTISVVPVGASPKLEDWALRKDGIAVEPATPEYAAAVVRSVGAVQRASRKTFGASIAQCADEFYLRAGIRVPGRMAYDGLPQYENGIGMVRVLFDDWHRTRTRLRKQPLNAKGRSLVIGSGTLAAPVMREVAAEFSSLTGASVEVVPVTNTVFGARVNVCGLVCGEDWATALAESKAEIAFLPRHSLDYFGEQFLDGLTPAQLSERLGKTVAFASLWSEVAEMLAHGNTGPRKTRASNGAMWSVRLPTPVTAH
jgi:NifB/MoaA-like Fe-S oxidoreductase